MSDKVELLKTLGFSEELLKYFQEYSEQPQVIVQSFESEVFENFDVTSISNINQVEVAVTTFTFSSEDH